MGIDERDTNVALVVVGYGQGCGVVVDEMERFTFESIVCSQSRLQLRRNQPK